MFLKSQGRFAALLTGSVLIGDAAGAQLVRVADGRGGFIERRCEAAAGPKRLPSFDAIVDSQSVMARLSQSAMDSSAALFSISFAENGEVRGVRLLEPTALTPSLADFAETLRTSARRQPRAQLWATRIRIQTGTHRIVIERSVYCPPQVDPDALGGTRLMLVQVEPSDRPPLNERRIRLVAELSLSESGDVMEVKLMQGSGLSEVDDTLIREYQMRRYWPALLDGEPLASWLRTDGRRMRL